MNFVEPIPDRKRVAQIKNQLCGQGRYRAQLLFIFVVVAGFVIGDTFLSFVLYQRQQFVG